MNSRHYTESYTTLRFGVRAKEFSQKVERSSDAAHYKPEEKPRKFWPRIEKKESIGVEKEIRTLCCSCFGTIKRRQHTT